MNALRSAAPEVRRRRRRRRLAAAATQRTRRSCSDLDRARLTNFNARWTMYGASGRQPEVQHAFWVSAFKHSLANEQIISGETTRQTE
eukprot:5486251-Pleurochrysis_carterae.AAC.2